MRLRLHGTPGEIDATLPVLRAALTVRAESRPYPDRPPSTLVRVYLDLDITPPAASRTHGGGRG
jgi:hypothetical protein